MNQKVLSTLTTVLDDGKLSEEFFLLDNMDDMYDYCQKIGADYS